MTLTADDRDVRLLDVRQATGVTYRQLDYWCRTGLLGERLAAPVRVRNRGRQFTDEDVMVVRVLGSIAWAFAGQHGTPRLKPLLVERLRAWINTTDEWFHCTNQGEQPNANEPRISIHRDTLTAHPRSSP